MESLKATFRKASPNGKKNIKVTPLDDGPEYSELGVGSAEIELSSEILIQPQNESARDEENRPNDKKNEKLQSIEYLVNSILECDDWSALQYQMCDVTESLNKILSKLSGSNSRLERKKSELASERLQLITAVRTLRHNKMTEDALKKEFTELQAQNKALFQADIAAMEKQLKTQDTSYYKRYSDISSCKEAKSLLQKATSKLEMWENIKTLTSNKVSQFEDEKVNKKKKNTQNKTSGKNGSNSESGSTGSSNTRATTRQQSIVESFRAARNLLPNADNNRFAGWSLPGSESAVQDVQDQPMSTAELRTPTSIRRGRLLLQSLMMNNPRINSGSALDNDVTSGLALDNDVTLSNQETPHAESSNSSEPNGDRRQQLILESIRNITESSSSSFIPRIGATENSIETEI